MIFAEVPSLGRATGRAVFRVEVDDNIFAAQIFQAHCLVAGCGKGKVRHFLSDCHLAHCWFRLLQVLMGSMIASRFIWSQNSMKSSRNTEIWRSCGMLIFI